MHRARRGAFAINHSSLTSGSIKPSAALLDMANGERPMSDD
jgi:hypothetical protein